MEYLVQSNIPLARGSMVRITDGRDLLVYVWSGAAWITQEGDKSDRFVPAGGWFRITSPGVTLISALERGAIALTSPYEEHGAERVEVLRSGTAAVETLVAPQGLLATWRARLTKSFPAWFAQQEGALP